MTLTTDDANLYFQLLWPLYFYVNQQSRIYSGVGSVEATKALSVQEKLRLRDELSLNRSLIDNFVRANPQGLSAEKLAIVAGWKNMVHGNFYLERILKEYAIFISENKKVYAVHALYDPFQSIFHPSQLPVFIKTVLLPFKGKIIYDGLFQGYNIYFGRGISSSLKETYMAAKQNRRIIERLDAEANESTVPASTKDWQPELQTLLAQVKKLRADADDPPALGPSFTLLKASLELALAATGDQDNLDALWKGLQKVQRAGSKIETVLNRAEFFD